MPAALLLDRIERWLIRRRNTVARLLLGLVLVLLCQPLDLSIGSFGVHFGAGTPEGPLAGSHLWLGRWTAGVYVLPSDFESPADLPLIQGAACLGLIRDQPNPWWTGRTPLMYAAYHGDVRTVERMLRRGANRLTVDYDGMDALAWNVWGGHEMVELLAGDSGVETRRARDYRLAAALSRAMLVGNLPAAESLLRLGAPLNLPLRQGRSLAHQAVLGNQPAALAWLRRHGAPLRAPDDRGITPANLATRLRRKALIRLLR